MSPLILADQLAVLRQGPPVDLTFASGAERQASDNWTRARPGRREAAGVKREGSGGKSETFLRMSGAMPTVHFGSLLLTVSFPLFPCSKQVISLRGREEAKESDWCSPGMGREEEMPGTEE